MKKLSFVPKYHQQIQSGENKGKWTLKIMGSVHALRRSDISEKLKEQSRIVSEGGIVVVVLME